MPALRFLDRTIKTYGPPGCGKTTYLLEVVERELNSGVKPDQIAFVTFTTAARKEALERVYKKFGLTQKDLPYFRTLHSTAYQQLNVTSAAMLKGPADMKPLADLLHVEFKGRWVDEDEDQLTPFGAGDGDKFLAFDHFRRHNIISIQDAYKNWDGRASFFEIKRFCDTYTAWKEQEGLIDFTDLLERVHEPLPVSVVIVDEAQDLSRLQWKTLDTFSQNADRVYLAGDDDQAIFSWAGADAEAFVQRPGQVRVLDQSHRLPRRVFEVADRITKSIRFRQSKIWRPRAEDGRVDRLIDIRHAQYDLPGTYLILYRNHYQGKAFEEYLRQLGLPYARSDKQTPGAQWAQAIHHWERLRKGFGLTAGEVLTVYEAMSSGQGYSRGAKKLLEQSPQGMLFLLDELEATYGLKTRAPWFEALTKIHKDDVMYLRRLVKNYGSKILNQDVQIKMSTIHGAKGAQANHVVLLTDMSGQTRESFDRNPDNERRVFYVGVTRAINTLTLVGMENPIF